MCDYNVGYIGVLRNLTREQIEKYTKNSKIYILSDSATNLDIQNAYIFIVKCHQIGINKFVLHIPSGNLIVLYELIEKNLSLYDCLFVATLSNAPIARSTIKYLKFYFPLTVVTDLIKTYTGIPPPPGNVMIVVSNDPNPYFDEILNSGPQPAYRINDLTVEKVNEFALTGYQIIVSIIFETEMNKFISIINDPNCIYQRQITFLELRSIFTDLVQTLKKVSAILALSSGVSLSADSKSYPDVTTITLYDNCSLTFCNNSICWTQFIKTMVLSNGNTYYGSNIVPLT